MSSEEQRKHGMTGGTRRASLEKRVAEKARARELVMPGEPPLAWTAYLSLALLAGLVGLFGDGLFFFLGLGFLGLAELAAMRRGCELAGARARQRMQFPPTKPPLRDGASPEERALAWASIACRASEQGNHIQAAEAWRRCDAAFKREGGMS